MAERPLSAVFTLFADWCGKNGVRDLNQTPGLYRVAIGRFCISLNAHPEEIEAIPPYTMGVFSTGGLPLGVVGPYGGALMFGAEDDLIEDLKAAGAEE